MEVKESDDFPRATSCCAGRITGFLRQSSSTSTTTSIALLEVIPREKTVVAPACTFPRRDERAARRHDGPGR